MIEDVMIDLETMGQSSNAAILAVGAVFFDLEGQKLGPKFYEVVDLKSCIDAGLKIDASTILWWMDQSAAARAQFKVKGKRLVEVLEEFSSYLDANSDLDKVKIWGNGADFDNVILGNAYKCFGDDVIPWKYYNSRCYRTMKNLPHGIDFGKLSGVAHKAVDDAVFQAENLMVIYEKMKWAFQIMIFECRIRKYNIWLKWFAWYPIIVYDQDNMGCIRKYLIWFDYVLRKEWWDIEGEHTEYKKWY